MVSCGEYGDVRCLRILFLLPLLDVGVIGPQMSEWISSKAAFALDRVVCGKIPLGCLPTTQVSHTSCESEFFGKPFTMFFL